MKDFAGKLILASNSPRRKQLLRQAGFEFEVVTTFYKEEKFETFSYENIKKNSSGKALSVARAAVDYAGEHAIVIGADTMVILDSVCLLNKPQDFSEAVFMLKSLSGRQHDVITAISLVDTQTLRALTEFSKTKVYFRSLNDEEIAKYIQEKNPLDKAGSYGIQDFITYEESKNPPPQSFIKKIEGDYYNVVGLDMGLLTQMLKRF